MVCQHKRYELGDVQYSASYADNWQEWFALYILENQTTGLELENYETYGYCTRAEFNKVWKWIEDNIIYFPISMYEHSGISIKVGNPTDIFDSGYIGYIYVTKDKVLQEYIVDSINPELLQTVKSVLIGEVETYNTYVSGDCLGYEVERVNGCWGFYTESDLMEDAKTSIDSHISKIQDLRSKEIKRWIRAKVPLIHRRTKYSF